MFEVGAHLDEGGASAGDDGYARGVAHASSSFVWSSLLNTLGSVDHSVDGLAFRWDRENLPGEHRHRNPTQTSSITRATARTMRLDLFSGLMASAIQRRISRLCACGHASKRLLPPRENVESVGQVVRHRWDRVGRILGDGHRHVVAARPIWAFFRTAALRNSRCRAPADGTSVSLTGTSFTLPTTATGVPIPMATLTSVGISMPKTRPHCAIVALNE